MPPRTAASTAAHMMWIAARCTSCTVEVTGVPTVIASAPASASGLGPGPVSAQADLELWLLRFESAQRLIQPGQMRTAVHRAATFRSGRTQA